MPAEESPYISQLFLRNIGKFEEVSIRLSPFTLLVGPNDAGKTTVLEALQTVCGASRLDLDRVRRDESSRTGRANTAVVEAVIQNPSPELVEYANLYDGDAAGIRLEWEITGDSEADVNLGSPNYFLRERVPEDERLHEWDYYAEEEKEILEDYDIDPGSNASARQEQYQELKERLLGDRENTCLDWISRGRQTFNRFTPPTEQIDTEDVGDPQSLLSTLLRQKTKSILAAEENAYETTRVDSLEEVEEFATEALNERLQSLSDRMNRYIPELEGVTVEPSWDFVRGADFSDIVLQHAEEDIPLQELGSGTIARSALSMLEWSAEGEAGDQSVIRTMDEPDHRLHFDVQRRLIKLLRNDISSEGSYLAQCVVSTHSLIMVDATPLHEVVYLPDDLDPGDERAPLLSRDEAQAGDIMGNIMAGLGLSASWVYLERAIIVVEGATEYNYITEIYHKITGSTLVEDGVQVWDCQGCGHIVRTLERLQDGGRARTFVALDADAKDREVSGETLQNVLEDMYDTGSSEPELVWLGEKELEDEWRKEDLVSLSEEYWPRADGNGWSDRHFTPVDEADKPSKKITHIIESGCAENLQDCPPVTKEQMGLRMGRLEGAEHPTPLSEIIDHVHDFCNQD